METTPENLKKYFKKLIYKILSYGEKKGSISVYFDESGYLDSFDYTSFYAGQGNGSQHEIDIESELQDYFRELMGEAVDFVGFGDRGGDVNLDIDVDNKILSIKVFHSVYKENPLFLKLNYNEIKNLSPTIDTIVEEYKELGSVLVCDYEGGGDSGWIEGKIYNEDDPDINETLNDRLEEFYYAILSDNFGSWGDNEGSRGKIILNLKKNEIYVEHVQYLEDTEVEENVIQKKILI
jgi:hypothetical protein